MAKKVKEMTEAEITKIETEKVLDENALMVLTDGLDMDVSSTEYLNAMKAAKITQEMQIEREKLEIEKAKAKSERRHSIANTVMNGVKIAGLLVLSAWGLVYTTDFEKEDSYTTTAGRNSAREVPNLFKRM